MFQKGSALAQWFRARTENARGTRKTMIVARKLLIVLRRLVTTGEVPAGFRSLRTEHRRHPMTIRGGHPKQAMVLTPVSRMGPPPRSFAADAHGCTMVRSL